MADSVVQRSSRQDANWTRLLGRTVRRIFFWTVIVGKRCPHLQVGFLSYSFEADGLRIDHSNITGNVQQLAGEEGEYLERSSGF